MPSGSLILKVSTIRAHDPAPADMLFYFSQAIPMLCKHFAFTSSLCRVVSIQAQNSIAMPSPCTVFVPLYRLIPVSKQSSDCGREIQASRLA